MRFSLIFVFTASAILARESWVRLESAPFELYTDAGERTGREVIGRLQQIHQVSRSLRFKDLPLPVRVFVFSSASEFRACRPTNTAAAFFQSGPERDFIVMPAGGDSRAIFHEYVHLALSHSSSTLPRWFEEGLAEYYSTLETSDDRLRIGRAIPEHIETLRLSRWLNAGQLDSPERGRAGLFYAESWALVHMLNSAPGYRNGVSAFSERLAGGAPGDDAFRASFGKTLDDAIDDLRKYLESHRFGVAERQIDPIETRDAGAARPMPEMEMNLVKSELFLLLGKSDLAEKLFSGRARGKADDPRTESILAMVAMGRGRTAEARERFAHAIDLGSRDAGTWFEYAMLLRDAREPDAEVLRLLHKATELNPKYAEAFFVAGTMEAKAGRHAEAVASLQKAADILPRQSNFWHAMAVSYMQLKQPEPAYRAAERASITAANDAERKAAAAILLAAAAPPPSLPASREPVIRIPDSWKNLPGDARVEGRLVKVECLGATAKLEIESEGKHIELKVLRPGKIPIQNSTSERREFTCGAQNPAPAAAIDYIRATGEVTAIQFK